MNRRLSRLGILIFGFSVVFSASLYAETEPNDTLAAANVVTLNTSVEGSLSSVSPADVFDYYSFTLERDGYFQVGVVPVADLNVEVALVDSDGIATLGYQNSQGNGGTEGVLYPNLLAGTYYALVKIPDGSAGMTGSYTATFSFAPVEEMDNEPNNMPDQPGKLPLNDETNGNIGFHGSGFTDNLDYYLIDLPADGQLELTVYPDGTGNVALGLYDSVIHNNLAWADSKGNGESEKIVYPNLRAGQYIVLVYSITGYGSYNLTSLFTEDSFPGGNEPNDSVSQAEEIVLTANAPSVDFSGRLGFYGNQYRDDSDYVKISVPAYGKLTLSLTAQSGSSLTSSYEVYDQQLRVIGSSGSPSYSLSGLQPGVYYVRLSRSGGYGAYSLSAAFEAQEEPQPVSGSPTVLEPNGQIGSILIDIGNKERWFALNLPEDGDLILTQKFEASAYVYMRLYSGDGLSVMRETYSYWTPDERSFEIPNIRKGSYLVNLSRADGAGTGTLTSAFTPVTKLDNESNDEYTSLSPIALNESYTGHIGYSGNGWMDTLDLYLLNVPEDGALTVTATGVPTLYFNIRLFDINGGVYSNISETYGYWNADPHTVGKVNVLAGQYLVQISRADGYGPYDMEVRFTPNRNNDPEINGNDWSQATLITTGEGYVGHLGYSRNHVLDSQDFYAVVLPEDGSFYITFQTDNTAFTYWRLYHSDMKSKISETYSYWTTETRTIGASDLRAGTYYLSIDRADGSGTYTFYSTFDIQQFTDPLANNAASDAVDLAFGDVANGALGYTSLFFRDTADWYRVNLTTGGRYKVTFQSVPSAFFYIALFSSNMVAQYSNDYRYWTSDLYSREFDLEAGTYYLRCSRADGYGSYHVRLGSLEGAATGILSGIVTSETNFPLAEVTVRVLNREVKTDFAGKFTFADMPPGTYQVSYTSGAKYYPESVPAQINVGQTTTLNVSLKDANKTAPKDVASFYGIAGDSFVNLFWTPSVSPDVADGGGYTLYYADGADGLQLGNVLNYRWFGIENLTYTFRLTVYDKYGNESQGKTLTLSVGGSTVQPTPRPTPTITPIPTIPGQPTATPTPTTHVQPVDTPTPIVTVVPTPAVVFEFDRESMQANGWVEIPGGMAAAQPGTFFPQFSISADRIPSSADNLGLAVLVKPGEVAFILTQTAVNTGGRPVLLRSVLRSNYPNASVVLGVLRGEVPTGTNVDGSIAYDMKMSAAHFIDGEGRICVIYQPDVGELITPFMQVAGMDGQNVNVLIDKVEVFVMEPGLSFPSDMFDNRP